jgi:hypothetical protein
MRSIFLCVVLVFASNLSIANDNCKTADAKSLSEIWIKFRDASLVGMPIEIEKFYEFPIRLYDSFDDSRPLLISKKNFLSKYDEIFRRVGDSKETILFSELKANPRSVWKKNAAIFDANGCYRLLGTPTMKINDYTFIWNKKTGWKIVSVRVNEDFELIASDGYPLGKK